MQLKVNNCGECPFMQTSQDLDAFCNHPDYKNYWEELPDYNDMVIHKDCPEGGAFKIKTSPITIQIKEDESK